MPRRLLIAPTTKAKIIDLLLGRRHVDDIADEACVSTATVRSIAAAEGIPLPSRRKREGTPQPKESRDARLRRLRAQHEAWKRSKGVSPSTKDTSRRVTIDFRAPIRAPADALRIVEERRRYLREHQEKLRSYSHAAGNSSSDDSESRETPL